MEQELHIEEINKQFVGINIVRYTIINYNNEDKNEVYNIDQAIISDFVMMKFIISQTSIFTPMFKMTYSEDVEMDIKSIDDVRYDYIDYDSDDLENLGKYKIRIN
jgi:hypothetical protein